MSYHLLLIKRFFIKCKSCCKSTDVCHRINGATQIISSRINCFVANAVQQWWAKVDSVKWESNTATICALKGGKTSHAIKSLYAKNGLRKSYYSAYRAYYRMMSCWSLSLKTHGSIISPRMRAWKSSKDYRLSLIR